MLNNIKINNNIEEEYVAEVIANKILEHLKKEESVLWLVPGGSAIKIAVLASRIISEEPHSNLVVSLTDERYGDVGHKDSNTKQLSDAGFSLPDAKIIPVLSNKSMEETSSDFTQSLERALKTSDYKIGFFGMGKDGHTAGILPNSEAVFADGLTCGYNTDTFKRITITFKAIEQLDEAVIYAVGEEKYPALKNLEGDLPLSEQPAQIYKKISKVTLFTDYNFNKK